MPWTIWNWFVRIATTRSIRRSTPHVTDLTETGTCCRRQEKRRGYAPPVGRILEGPEEPREIPQKNSAGSHAYEGG